MIRLAVSDLDGTLLTPERRLPENTFEIIRKLKEKGIVFGAASGRQLQNLIDFFAPVADDIVIIAENGGLGWMRGELLFCNAVPPEKVEKTLQAVHGSEGLFPLLCAPDCAYYEDLKQPFESYVNASYTHTAQADLRTVAKSVPICKIAVYDALGAEKNGIRVLPELLPDLRVIQSGMDWLDVSEKSVNKGAALSVVLKKLGISPDECMAFGDHMNDFEMLQACGHPRVPENAFYKMKEAFPHVIPSNKDYGVVRTLESLL